MYQVEHDEMFAAIRAGKPINNGEQAANSTLLAIMGRMAAYTGQILTPDQVLNSKLDLSPASYEFGPNPVPPVPVPGTTTFDMIASIGVASRRDRSDRLRRSRRHSPPPPAARVGGGPWTGRGLASRIWTVPSTPALASWEPSGLKATVVTMSVWPRRVSTSCPVWVSQRLDGPVLAGGRQPAAVGAEGHAQHRSHVALEPGDGWLICRSQTMTVESQLDEASRLPSELKVDVGNHSADGSRNRSFTWPSALSKRVTVPMLSAVAMVVPSGLKARSRMIPTSDPLDPPEDLAGLQVQDRSRARCRRSRWARPRRCRSGRRTGRPWPACGRRG